MTADTHPVALACAAALKGHAHLRERIAALDAAIKEGAPGPRLAAPWAHFTREIAHHMEVEEERLFPALIALSKGASHVEEDFAAPLHEMQFEVDEIRTLADAVRVAAPELPLIEVDLVNLMDELEAHAEREEKMLFPAAQALLAEIDRAAPTMAPARAPAKVLRETRGQCHTCNQQVPAEVRREGSEVWLTKLCPDHGESRQLLSRAADYWEDVDRYYFQVNEEEYPQRDFMVRMTERCNLDCPICLAKANTEDTPDLDLSGLEKLLSERRGIKIDLLAAEPTLREDLEDWIRKVKASGNIAALHTNGLKLADMAYAKRMQEAGIDEVFLQFDGFDEEANKLLRGRPLIKARTKALENLRALGIGTSLIVVVARGVNEAQIAKTYQFAMQPENDHIREVFFLGLRLLGSARDSLKQLGTGIEDMALMPDELIDMLCEQDPTFTRTDIRRFNKIYFALLSAFKVKKCLYVQHYLVARGPGGKAIPARDLMDLAGLEKAAERYAARFVAHPTLAKAGLLAALGRYGVTRDSARMLSDLVRLQSLFYAGMNLGRVPRRFLILGFITACDPHNFDASVAINCGKGELSVDGGFIESGAVANVRREQRFDETDLRPGEAKRKKKADAKIRRGGWEAP